MENDRLQVYGFHGNSHKVPADTTVSYWSALGAGADGIVAALQITKDKSIVCCPASVLTCYDGSSINVNDMTLKEFKDFDAGASFQSELLDANNQPGGETGKYHPWASDMIIGRELPKPVGSRPVHPTLHYLTLEYMLKLFGRRTSVFLYISDQDSDLSNEIVESTLATLKLIGLQSRVTIIAPDKLCTQVRSLSSNARVAYIADQSKSFADNVDLAVKVDPQYLFVNLEYLTTENDFNGESKIPLLISSSQMEYAPTPTAYEEILSWENVAGLCFKAVEECVEFITPPALIILDDLKTGTVKHPVNPDIWSCGYSHVTDTVELLQDNGFVINLKEGGSYSGGAALTLLPVHGRFDAQVDFHVSNPHQGTTFELAVISQDPGYYHSQNTDLDSRSLNLTFDVHGAPPYASCERDENDGFRIGWNNCFNLTKIDKDWKASSANMYNKYSRDVGHAGKDNPKGTYRLVRNGSVFNAYYKDAHNKGWVCSGSALVPNLPEDVYIRLAAKHWRKGQPITPGNRIVFSNFKLYQF